MKGTIVDISGKECRLGAFLGIRLVKFLPERGFRIFTTMVTVISVIVMLLT